MNTALRALSITLRELLTERLRGDLNLGHFFNPALGGTLVVSLANPEEASSAGRFGVSVWLYRLERDEFTQNQRPHRVSRDRLLHQPLPLRAHYLITPVVAGADRPDGAELEQNILGVVLQTLNDHATLRGADLRGDLAGSGQEITLRLENLEIDQLARVWDALEESFQLCVSYEAAVVPIDSALQPEVAVAVDAALPMVGLARPVGEAP